MATQMERMKTIIKRKKALFLVFALLLMAAFAGCSDGEGGGSGELQDPYEAYGLERESSYNNGETLMSAMQDRPPKAIVLEPVFYYRAYYETVPQTGTFTLERGESIDLSLDMELVHETGATATVRSNITLKYDGEKEEDLFHADTSTYGNPTLIKDGLYITEYGDHVAKDFYLNTEQIAANNGYGYELDGPAEEFLYIPLKTDKGDAQSGDGNIGFLYLRIVGVRL